MASSPPDGCVLEDLPTEVRTILGALWGKSGERFGGFSLLAGHMFDSVAVGELVWDRYMSPAVRHQIDAAAGGEGRGRALFSFLCGIHDIGKATPVFQMKVDNLWLRVNQAGLSSPSLGMTAKTALHSDAGGKIVKVLLGLEPGWSPQAVDMVWPLVAGHHGIIKPGPEVWGRRSGVRKAALGWESDQDSDPGWRDIQRVLLNITAKAAGFSCLAQAAPVGTAKRGLQLVISGLIILADWIASSSSCAPKAVELSQVRMSEARLRATAAWESFKLRGGWDLSAPRPPDIMRARFHQAARPVQQVLIEAAQEMPRPGLIIVEAPMGEGKTEAALAAAEVLAHRFGLDGLFIGMPTQATSDPMFSRVLEWTHSLGCEVPVALSHGRARFNRQWRELLEASDPEIDLFGDDNTHSGQVIRWLLGRDRPLLTPLCVGTIDNLLHAATRTKRVALRFSGLGGKVVILDEIHSYSVYTQQFLSEALRWLGSVGSPVVLLTATLPPAQKADLLAAYIEGASGQVIRQPALTNPANPLVTWICASPDGEAIPHEVPAEGALPQRHITLEVLEDQPGDAVSSGTQADLTGRLAPVVAAGGRVLVICNTVQRAQEAYSRLRDQFGPVVDLLHARFTAGDRAQRAESIIQRFGPAAAARPGAQVLVGTQVLEQSLDIDADLIVSDLAPIDLLLQRIGRAHRHVARDRHRPACVAEPHVIITGLRWGPDGNPLLPRYVDKIYAPDVLLRSAALILQGLETGWQLPQDIRPLVAQTYSDEQGLIPDHWLARYLVAREVASAERSRRRRDADSFLLGRPSSISDPTLDGLHSFEIGQLPTEDAVGAVVRDGPETAEVVLLENRAGDIWTLSGRRLTRGDVPVDDDEAAIQDACASLVRLPPYPQLTKAARSIVPHLAFADDPDLGGLRFVGLGETLGGYVIGYDPSLGLTTKLIQMTTKR
ncbi:MAG: CRISPR-associated helicase Cas3' [Bifidobacteriaceae bacterium]|nr:CRISPR-associated helicase Cas3' [Bifidobacteriaceae bacterium]